MAKKKKDLPVLVGIDEISPREAHIEAITELEPGYRKYLETLPAETRRRIVTSVTKIRTGLHAVAPVMCLGPEECPFISKCPIPTRDSCGTLHHGSLSNYPIGRECVLEKFYMEQKVIEYMNHLKVDPENPVEMAIVNELAVIDLYKNRCLMIMSVGDKSGQGRDFMRVDIIGFNENGDLAETSKIHPGMDVLDRLEKRREKWLDKLMETRKSKADWMVKMGTSGGESKILTEIQDLKKAISDMESTPVEIDVDDELLLDD